MGALTLLAEELLARAKVVDAYLEDEKLPQASFQDYNLDDVPIDVKDARDHIIDNAAKLQRLCEPPEEFIFWDILAKWTDMTSIQVLYHYDIPAIVPLNRSMSYADIATKVGASEEMIKRFVRQAQSNNIFDETSTGEVCHTTLSRRMATQPGLKDAFGLQTDLATGGLAFMPAVKKYGEPRDHDATAFSYVNSPNEKKSIFQIFQEQPERAKRFGGAMRWLTSGGTWDLRHLDEAFDWAAIDQPGFTMVDVGGGHGQVAQHLAEKTSNMQFIVQDLPHVVQQAEQSVPKDLHSRLSFQPQSFLEPQSLSRPADIFFYRWILHNWSDSYCITMLKGLIPSLKAGSKVLVFEYVLSEKPITQHTQRMGRALDIIMAVGFGGKERTELEFKELFALADSRYHFDGVTSPRDSSLSLVSATWVPDLVDEVNSVHVADGVQGIAAVKRTKGFHRADSSMDFDSINESTGVYGGVGGANGLSRTDSVHRNDGVNGGDEINGTHGTNGVSETMPLREMATTKLE